MNSTNLSYFPSISFLSLSLSLSIGWGASIDPPTPTYTLMKIIDGWQAHYQITVAIRTHDYALEMWGSYSATIPRPPNIYPAIYNLAVMSETIPDILTYNGAEWKPLHTVRS